MKKQQEKLVKSINTYFTDVKMLKSVLDSVRSSNIPEIRRCYFKIREAYIALNNVCLDEYFTED